MQKFSGFWRDLEKISSVRALRELENPNPSKTAFFCSTGLNLEMSSIMDDAPADSRSLDGDRKWSLQPLLRKAERSHQKMPGIRKIPLRAIAIILFIALLNAIVWIAAAIVLVSSHYSVRFILNHS